MSLEEKNIALGSIPVLIDFVKSKSYRDNLGLDDDISETYKFLGAGEYNKNFVFVHPKTKQKLVLRVECGSQLHLDNQIEYESKALEILKKSGRVPEVYYYDSSKTMLDHGISVMQFMPGIILNYKSDYDLNEAAKILSDIHSCESDGVSFLIRANNPSQTMFDECLKMANVYLDSKAAKREIKQQIIKLLERAENEIKSFDWSFSRVSIINTELNNTNFLINKGENSYLIDWEKPLFSDPAQDIGHFLADTTTMWKSDFYFTEPEKSQFVDNYIDKIAGRFSDEGLKKRCLKFADFTCLRGICWCAMAYVQYINDEKELFNSDTFENLHNYLDVNFLQVIRL